MPPVRPRLQPLRSRPACATSAENNTLPLLPLLLPLQPPVWQRLARHRFGAGVHNHIHPACVRHGGAPQRAAARNCRLKGARAARAARAADGGAAFGAGLALLGATGVMSGQLACAAQRSRWRCSSSSLCASGPIPPSPGLPSPITCPFHPPPSLLEKPEFQIRLTMMIDNTSRKVKENVGFIVFSTLCKIEGLVQIAYCLRWICQRRFTCHDLKIQYCILDDRCKSKQAYHMQTPTASSYTQMHAWLIRVAPSH